MLLLCSSYLVIMNEMYARHLNKNADDFEAACKSLDITER